MNTTPTPEPRRDDAAEQLQQAVDTAWAQWQAAESRYAELKAAKAALPIRRRYAELKAAQAALRIRDTYPDAYRVTFDVCDLYDGPSVDLRAVTAADGRVLWCNSLHRITLEAAALLATRDRADDARARADRLLAALPADDDTAAEFQENQSEVCDPLAAALHADVTYYDQWVRRHEEHKALVLDDVLRTAGL